jgi:hypothetical protein
MPELPPEIDTSRPHSARVYDYMIGGKNNFAADRETAAQVLKHSPNAHTAARENRAFLGRAVRFLTASHLTMEHDSDPAGGGVQAMRAAGITMRKRASDEFARLAFSGLELVPPGVVLVSDWRRSGSGLHPTSAEVNAYGGVARKP